MASIRGKDVAGAVKIKEAEGVGPKTLVIYLGLLSHLFTIARKEWGMESLGNPVELVRKPKLPQGRTRHLVDDEESRLLAFAASYGGEVQHLIPWAVETAMRRGEIAAMRWDHLDKKARVLLIPETKTGTPRRVPLSSRALVVLDALPRRIDGAVWSMRADSISQAFERAVAAARAAYEQECKQARQKPDAKLLKNLRFHDLHHEATSRLFEKGLNPMQVAAITGHKTLQMLKRYTHLRAGDLVEDSGDSSGLSQRFHKRINCLSSCSDSEAAGMRESALSSGVFSNRLRLKICSSSHRLRDRLRRFLMMATSTQTDTEIQICDSTAFSEVPKNVFTANAS